MKAVKVNHFDRLPEALIIEIFNKLVHAKYLLRFSTVCRRFASLADHIDTTIFIPTSLSRGSAVGQFPLLALNKFTAIRSLQIEFWRSSHTAAAGGGSSARMKCKAVIGARLEVFVSVIATSVHKSLHLSDGGSGSGSGGDTSNYNIGIEEEARLTLIRCGLENILSCQGFVQSLINGFDLPQLCELGVTCKRLGFSVDLGKEQIVKLRNRRGISADCKELKLSDVIGGDGVVWVKSWHGPMLLELPSSGRVMERATIAVVKPEGEEIEMEKDIGVLLGVFGGGGRGGGRRRRSRRRNDDDGEVIDEFVNLVRKMMVQSNQDGDSIQTHRLELV